MKPNSTTATQSLAELSPLERRRKVAVREAAALNDVSEATFRRHYGHLIRKIGLRRDAVELGDAINLPPPPGEDHQTRNRLPCGGRPVKPQTERRKKP